MAKTNISWCDWTINFQKWFCTKVSLGCKNCYMFPLAARYPANSSVTPEWRENGVKELHSAPPGAFIFVGDMYDQYHKDTPTEWIQRVHTLIAERDDCQFMLLTKRIELVYDLRSRLKWPQNLWMGVSVEHPQYLSRINFLRQIPAETKFISFEPLLQDMGEINLEGIDMAIVGAESGTNRRPFDKQWARNIYTHCCRYGTAFFYKQSSGQKPGVDPYLDGQLFREYPDSRLPLKYQGNTAAQKPVQLEMF